MVIEIEEDENGNLILPISEELMKELDWNIGDVLEWKDNGDKTFTLKRSDK